MTASGTCERRRFPRTDARVMVSYFPESAVTGYGVGYTRNVSAGGTVFTSSRPFESGSRLALTLRFPFAHKATEQVAEVVSSKETVKKLLYEIRLRFLEATAEPV